MRQVNKAAAASCLARLPLKFGMQIDYPQFSEKSRIEQPAIAHFLMAQVRYFPKDSAIPSVSHTSAGPYEKHSMFGLFSTFLELSMLFYLTATNNAQSIRVDANDGTNITKYLIDPYNHTGYAQVLKTDDGTTTANYECNPDVIRVQAAIWGSPANRNSLGNRIDCIAASYPLADLHTNGVSCFGLFNVYIVNLH